MYLHIQFFTHSNSRYAETPTFRGYQTFFGSYQHAGHFNHTTGTNSALHSYYDMHWHRKRRCGPNCISVVNRKGTYSSYAYADAAVERVNNHNKEKGPLFLYVAFTATHTPIEAPEDEIRKYQIPKYRKWGYQRKVYAAMLTATDKAINDIKTVLIKKGLWKDTLVIVTTDNGAAIKGCATHTFSKRTYCGQTVRQLVLQLYCKDYCSLWQLSCNYFLITFSCLVKL